MERIPPRYRRVRETPVPSLAATASCSAPAALLTRNQPAVDNRHRPARAVVRPAPPRSGKIVGTMAAVSEPPWEELRGNLRAFISRRVRNQADVDDLVQRVLLQIVKGLGTLRDAERLHAWVYRAARNVIVDYYRSSAVRHEVASGDAADLASADGADGQARFDEDEGTALRELAACMTPMIRQLPPTYREAIMLADLEGVNQADAAERAGVSLSGMKSRIQRGRKQLKAVLEDCCRVELDRRGAIVAYDARKPGSCACGDCD